MNTLTLNIQALPWQKNILDPWPDNIRYKLCVSGVGGGKTYGLGLWLVTQRILRNQGVPNLLCANTYTQLRDSTIPQFEKFLLESGIPFQKQKSPSLDYTIFGTKIRCRSLDNFGVLAGSEVGAIAVDEARDVNPEAWRRVLKSRLRHRGTKKQEALLVSTANGHDWMYDEFYRKPSEGKNPDHGIVYGIDTRDNIFLPADYINSLLTSMDADLAKQEIEGLFIIIGQGRIYYTYNAVKHERNDFTLDVNRPLIHAWDFNVDPHITLVGQLQDAGLIWFDELVMRGVGTPEMADLFIRGGKDGAGNEHPAYGQWPREIYVMGDAGGGQRKTASSAKSDWAIIEETYRDAGLDFHFDVPRANPMIEDRYQIMRTLLSSAKGEVRMYHTPTCKNLRADMESMTYKKGTRILEHNAAQYPDRTHASDAAGYAAMRLAPQMGVQIIKRRGWRQA